MEPRHPRAGHDGPRPSPNTLRKAQRGSAIQGRNSASSSFKARCDHGPVIRVNTRPSGARANRLTVPGRAFGRVLGQAGHHLRRKAVHAALRHRRGIEEVGGEAGVAERPGQGQSIVTGSANRRVAADLSVGFRAGDKQLAATRGVARTATAAHAAHGQETEQHKMDQGDEQPFGKRAGELPWDATGQRRPGLVHERDQGGQRSGLKAHVGLHEDQPGVPGALGQLVAGELFAAPTGRESGA